MITREWEACLFLSSLFSSVFSVLVAWRTTNARGKWPTDRPTWLGWWRCAKGFIIYWQPQCLRTSCILMAVFCWCFYSRFFPMPWLYGEVQPFIAAEFIFLFSIDTMYKNPGFLLVLPRRGEIFGLSLSLLLSFKRYDYDDICVFCVACQCMHDACKWSSALIKNLRFNISARKEILQVTPMTSAPFWPLPVFRNLPEAAQNNVENFNFVTLPVFVSSSSRMTDEVDVKSRRKWRRSEQQPKETVELMGFVRW